MRILKTLLIISSFMLVVTFSMQNHGNGSIRYFNIISPLEIPLFLLVLLSIFLGIVVGGMADLVRRYQLRRTIRGQRKTIDQLQREMRGMRNLPPEEKKESN